MSVQRRNSNKVGSRGVLVKDDDLERLLSSDMNPKRVRWDSTRDDERRDAVSRLSKTLDRSASSTHAIDDVESSFASVLGWNVSGLANRAASIKHYWLGNLGSSLFPSKEHEGQVMFSFALVAVYMLVKAVMGTGSPLVVAIGLFLAAGKLTKFTTAAPSRSVGDDTNQVIELDIADSPSRPVGASAESIPRSTKTTTSKPRSLLDEAVEELRRSHQSVGTSSTSRHLGREAGQTAAKIDRALSHNTNDLDTDGGDPLNLNDLLAKEFVHHRKRPVSRGENTLVSELPECELDVEVRPSGGAAATARRNRKSRVMRVQIKQRTDVPDFNNIILR